MTFDDSAGSADSGAIETHGPLEGIRILDFSRVLSGPFATMTLADLGADVVKVERPGRGDDTRGFGPPFVDDVSTYFLSINRGKRSLALDLKDSRHRARALDLCDAADVVVENFRPGVMKRLGFDAETLRARNEQLIYCSISGFGQEAGPKPGYDLVIQGLGGVASLTGAPDTPPFKCGASIADIVAGMNAVQAILAALYRRERTGRGSTLDVSMLAGQNALLTYHASAWLNAGEEPTRIGNAHPSIHPFCAYAARDGWLNVAVGNDRLFATLCEVLGEEDEAIRTLADDERFSTNPARVANRSELDDILAPVFERHDVSRWLDVLDAAGVPAGPIASVSEALESAPRVAHSHPTSDTTVETVALPWRQLDDGEELPRAAHRRAPSLGEHETDVLREWLGSD